MRELFERIDERLVRLDEKLDSKASHSDVGGLADRVDRLESTKDRAWGALLGAGLGSGAVAGTVVSVLANVIGS
ncbi:MAG: hypothetical protein GWN73_17515 [Actinobacteria bacterium]|nr:hypothetical protein [Actinomycetota bacterium]NIS32055.1 hypothetical protein [Actinomycetota bacterium]NIU67127.1 hypothetical protein [Actinomycetota bacterium]NIW28906.1 hypothetical protein [Actinomycetota bacterium]